MSHRLPPSTPGRVSLEGNPATGIVHASSPSPTSPSATSAGPQQYYQQTTSSIFDSALVFTFIATIACLLLFSFARTRRSSIYGSRQFFVRDEHQADAPPSTFFGWIAPLLFFERKIERTLRQNQNSNVASVSPTRNVHQRSSVSEKEGSTSNPPHSDQQQQQQQRQLSDHDVASTPRSRWLNIQALSSLLKWASTVINVQATTKNNGSSAPTNRTSNTSDTTSHQPSTFQSGDVNTEAARDAVVAKIGLDHYLLVRFLKMLFTISTTIAIVALAVLVPVYSIGQAGEDLLTTGEIMDEDGAEGPRIRKIGGGWFVSKRIEMLQIGNVTDNKRLWAAVVITAAFSMFAFIWIWFELMEFLKLRQAFLFRSASRYSSRVVLLQHLPLSLRSVSALKQAFASADGGVEYVYLVHDVSALDKAVKRRQIVLDRLEEAEFRYMDAIARASAMVATTTLSMRSRSWVGELVDKAKDLLGIAKTTTLSSNIGGQGNTNGVVTSNPEDEDYVGPLKMYQLEDVPKLSLTDLSSPADAAGRYGSTPSPTTPKGAITSVVSSSAGTAASLTPLKWFQKPRRPRHYSGIPLLSKRQDSIRYYRGELCRLNKLIAQGYAQQMQAMVEEQQQQPVSHGRNVTHSHNQKHRLEDIAVNEKSAVQQSNALSDQRQLMPLASAFLLMRTRAGAKMAAGPTLAPDQIDVHSRVLGISPRDIEWRVLGQTQSSATCMFHRTIILGIAFVLSVSCGLVVSAISSLAVDHGWERVLAQDAMISAPSSIYWRQGILTPILLTALMLGGSWILNELCQVWGQVSKTQGELRIQQYYFLFLMVNMVLIHPILSLSFSWQESTTIEMNGLSAFLIHAMPSYCSFAIAYILMSGLALPLLQLLQLPRLWATLPALTLWSVLGPLSWRKSTRNRPKHPSANDSSSKYSTASSSASSTASSSAFEANFTPAPTQTPRQAFQIRQPPFLQLQNLYPHLILLFLLSLTLLPLAPLLFLLWIVVLLVLNLCYRYLVLQVVTTKSQSGGLHYLQAVKLLLFPTLACPPALLAIYLLIRQAWVQASFTLVLTFAVLAMRVVFAIQFGKREEMMLAKVEDYHSRPKILSLHSGQGNHPAGAANTTTTTTTTTNVTVVAPDSPVVDLGHMQPGDESQLMPEAGGENDGAGAGHLSPGRRRVRRMMQRPTTIIGQVRNSMFSSHSNTSSNRPKSVPHFDLERYEKEILGINNEKDSIRDRGTPSNSRLSSSQHQISQVQSQDDKQELQNSSNEKAPKDHVEQAHTSLVRAKTIATTTPTFDPASEVAFSDLFSEYTTQSNMNADSALSKAEELEDEKEAKYREIVIALRRATSVASQRLVDTGTSGSHDHPRRRAGPGGLAGIAEHSLGSPLELKRGGPSGTNNTAKANFRASLPVLSKYPSTRAHNPQRSLGEALSNNSPTRFSGGGNGVPSLPMLLIHRESAVAAKEWQRIQNLYLHPALAEAKARVLVWLPSQTEQSFMGLSRETQGAAARFLAQCKVHSNNNAGGTSPSIRTSAAVSGISMSTLTPGHGHGHSPDRPPTAAATATGAPPLPCTCQLYQELMRAVADAVALADQEVRDLRIVGLTVWLDSRHVVWGEPSEEDGRLGDRVMIAGGPSTTTLVLGGGGSSHLFGLGARGQAGGTHVGDGLLSWLEDEDHEGGGRGEEVYEEGMGTGAPGIVGGSMGVIMKRPIGYYGRLVGDGEEDDISRGLL